MVIVVIISALVITGFSSPGAAQDLTSGADFIAARCEYARQTAQTGNERVELRLWYAPDIAGVGSAYRAVQLFHVDSGLPIDGAQRLPASIIIMVDDNFSSLLSNANPYGGVGNMNGIPGIPFKSIRFGPSGSAELNPSGPSASLNAWTLTLIYRHSQPNANPAAPAKNFATIQVEPVTGRTTIYRP